MATMKVNDRYTIDKEYECKNVYKTTDIEHPGVKILPRPGRCSKKKAGIPCCCIPDRNPMHRSHEYLAKDAIEI